MIAKKTLEAIDDAILAAAEPPHRAHLGASLMGEPCERKLWYVWRWALAEQHEARMLRLFNRGHLEEKRFVAYLRSIGIEVWEAGESGELKSAMRFSDFDGNFGGTPDGVARNFAELPQGEPAIVEFKTHNRKSFDKLKEYGVIGSKFGHFVQMQLGMLKLKLQYAVYLATCKDDDDLFAEVVQFDEVQANKALAKAGRVLQATRAPARVSESPASNACRFCHMQRFCHFGDVKPDMNCRTCAYSQQQHNCLWFCHRHKVTLSVEQQRAGCQGYEQSPLLTGPQP